MIIIGNQVTKKFQYVLSCLLERSIYGEDFEKVPEVNYAFS